MSTCLNVAQVTALVEVIDQMHAENAVDVDPQVALFYAHSRLDGAYVLAALMDAADQVLEVLGDALLRYEGLMDGAPESQAEAARLAHSEVLLRIRGTVAVRDRVLHG